MTDPAPSPAAGQPPVPHRPMPTLGRGWSAHPDVGDPPRCPLDGAPLRSVESELGKPTVYVHRNGGEHPDRLAQLLRDVDTTRRPILLARAIGWFRR